MRPFIELLKGYIEERGLADQEFAELVGRSQPSISQVINGKRFAPYKDVEHWADALNLNGVERREFILAAHLDNAPRLIVEYVHELLDRLNEEL